MKLSDFPVIGKFLPISRTKWRSYSPIVRGQDAANLDAEMERAEREKVPREDYERAMRAYRRVKLPV